MACTKVSTNLQPFLTKPIDLKQIQVVEHPGSVWETMASCNKQSWAHDEYGYLLFSLGLQIGCSYLSGPSYGKVERCDIWYPEGSKRIREEELKHCEGYID